jgi:hypothetical protein
MSLKKRHLFLLLAMAVVAALLPSPAAASGPTVTPVAGGLDSPRGVAFYHGKLLVAEAGHGGTDCFFGGAGAGNICFGESGRISWINNGVRTTLIDHMLSITARGGFDSEGPSGLSISEGRILAQIATPPQEAPSPPTITPADFALAQQQAGRLISVHTNGTWSTVAEVGKFDFNYTLVFPEPPGPGTQEHDANPYGVLATDEGAYVADAGSNTLDRIDEDGKIKIVFHDGFRFSTPNFPSDSVPTCVVTTEDGLLVGELSGRLLKVHGTTFTVINNPLLSHITGCTSDGRGNVYFVNMFGSGAPFTPPPASNFFIGNVVQYNAETGKASMLANGLMLPNMDTIGPDGNLYVSVGSICPTAGFLCNGAAGGVVKIILPHGENEG